jgi:hypothetical protein
MTVNDNYTNSNINSTITLMEVSVWDKQL